jgi:putative CocE/NonD family hydrolase
VGGEGAIIEFLRHHLLATPAPDVAPVRAFVTGANRWLDGPTWPPPGVTTTPLYLGPAGALTFAAPTGADQDVATSYVSDPNDPVPTLGGATLFAGPTTRGVWDQRRLDARPDIVRFVGPLLDDDLIIAGSVTAVLHVSTTGKCGDWAAKLIDVHPNGAALNVCDGVIRPAWTSAPGQPDEVTIDLGPVAHQFTRGHRIRLDVASSSFPLIDRNPQTGMSAETAGPDDLQPATVAVWHDRDHRSRLDLPVLR